MMHWESGIFKEIKNFWDISAVIMPVNASSMREQTCLTCSQSRTQCWGQHLAQSGDSIAICWVNSWKNELTMSAAASRFHALYLVLRLKLSISWVMDSCHNCSSKGTLTGSEWWHSAKSSAVLTFTLISFLLWPLTKWEYIWQTCSTRVDYDASAFVFQTRSLTHHTRYGTHSPISMLCTSEWYWTTEVLFFPDLVSLWNVSALVQSCSETNLVWCCNCN